MAYVEIMHSDAVGTSDAKRLRLLKVKRNSFRNEILSLQSFVEEYEQTPKNRLQLQERLDRLKKCLNEFSEVQDEITMIDGKEELQRTVILKGYDGAVAEAKVLLGAETAAPAPGTTGSQTSPALMFNLPKIELPKFDGRMEKWMAFKDAFTTTVHNEAGLSNVQKLAHLRSLLVGEAETILDGFLTTEENYERAWKHLLDTYDSRRWLAMYHVAHILKTPEMSDETEVSFKRTLEHMQRHVRWLQTMGRTAKDIGVDLLIGILAAKMTPEAYRAWEKTLTDTEMPRLEHLYKYMQLSSHQSGELSDDCDNVTPAAKVFATQTAAAETAASATAATGSQPLSKLTINLPNIELPKFDGTMEKWIAFKDAFTAMVHNEAGLSNVQKLAQLRCSLVGDAEKVLDGFLTTEENYERAWKHLLENYDNERWLVMHHVANILKTPEMSDETPDSFKRTLGHMQRHVRWLRVFGRTAEDIGNDLLVGILSAKMTPDAYRGWEKSLTGTEMPRIEHLYKYMRLASIQTRQLMKKVSAKAAKISARSATCANCGELGHTGRNCPYYD